MSHSDQKFREKYVDGTDFAKMVTSALILEVSVVSSDTINETILQDAIKKTGAFDEFLCVACQLALGGFGGRDYNQYTYKGVQKELKMFFDKHQVRYNNSLQAKLKPEDLTPRRIIRVFRGAIHRILVERKDLGSYLFKKYTDQDERFRTTCFAGSEHFIKTKEDADYLLSAYKSMDTRMKENNKPMDITNRITRVLQVRGIKTSKIAATQNL